MVGPDGEQVGIVDIVRAQNMADDAKLDLVKVAPGAKPPVCRIMDYGKYKYDMMKKEKESRKKQKVINVKELRFSPNIEEHDLQTKANQGKSFLSAGDRVKVSVRFRGRELGHTDIGRKVLDRFVELIADEGVIDKAPKMEGRSMVMFLSPKSEKDKN